MERTEPTHGPARLSSTPAWIQGARDAQELLNAIRAGVAPKEALHWTLQSIRRPGDQVRLRGFTLEIQRALREGQRRSSELHELRLFTDYRARVTGLGGHLHRTDPADGPVTYFIALRGAVRPYIDLGAVQDSVVLLEARQAGDQRRASKADRLRHIDRN